MQMIYEIYYFYFQVIDKIQKNKLIKFNGW